MTKMFRFMLLALVAVAPLALCSCEGKSPDEPEPPVNEDEKLTLNLDSIKWMPCMDWNADTTQLKEYMAKYSPQMKLAGASRLGHTYQAVRNGVEGEHFLSYWFFDYNEWEGYQQLAIF